MNGPPKVKGDAKGKLLAMRTRWTMTGWSKAAAVLLVLLAGLTAGRAAAQEMNSGTVAGNVVDGQGAVIPNAVITLKNNAEGGVQTATSNAKGEYLFNDVKIGMYTLKVTSPTFKTYVVSNIQVDANQNVRQDAQMQAGAVDSQVTVEAQGTTIDTRSATLGTMIDNKLVEGLPIDGENIVSLAAILPGVTDVNAPTTFTSDTGGPTYSVSGSRGNQNLFLFDGLIWNNVFFNTGLNYPPRLAEQEVSVLLNNYKAQYGRNSGSIFNVLTKSGTNQYHGALWEYYQNSAFDASDYLTHRDPHLIENQFGATLGGPIKRDKAFFFLSYQDLRLASQVIATSNSEIPIEMGYAGTSITGNPNNACSATAVAYWGASLATTCGNFAYDFAAGVNPAATMKNPEYSNDSAGLQTTAASVLNLWSQAQGQGSTNPCLTVLQNKGAGTGTTAEYLPSLEVPTACFSGLTTQYLKKYLPVALTSLGGANLLAAVTAAPQPRNDQEGLIRGDVNLGRHTVDARFYVTNVNDVTSNSVSQGVGIANYEQDQNQAGIYAGSIRDTWVLTPNLLNVIRAGYKRYTYIITPTDRTSWSSFGNIAATQLGLTSGSSLVSYAQPGPSFLPKVEVTGRFTLGSTNSSDSYTMTANQEYDDDLSWTHGNHNVQVGAELLYLNYVHRFASVPTFESEQQFTEANMADFLMGFMYGATVGNSTNLAATQYDLYLYAQDDWRATSRLTLNLGVRYELPFSWNEADGWGATFKPGFQSTVWPTAPSSVGFQNDPGIGNPAPPTKYKNWGPRVGFAYDVHGDGKLSVRGGFGIFYDTINASVVGVSEPYHYSAFYQYPNGGFTAPLLGEPCIPPNYVKGQSASAGAISAAGCNANSSYFALPYSILYADPNLHNPYTMAANFGFQQRVWGGGNFEMNYVGKYGRHQIIPIDQNPSIYDCSGSYFLSNPTLYCPTSSAATLQPSYEARSLYPGFNYGGQGIVDMMSVGTSSYNGLQAIFSQRASKSINIYASYAYARSIDESSNGLTTTANVPQPHNLGLEYAASDFNAQQIFNVGWVVKLPKAAPEHTLRALFFNDWNYSGIYNARTGNPINITISGDKSYTDERTQRASLVPGMSPTLPSNRPRVQKVNEWFNINAFQQPADGTFSNLRRNFLVGPAFINTNMTMWKSFTVHQGVTTEFRLDGFNVFNTPNLANPNTALSAAASNQQSGSFGSVVTTVGTNGAIGTNGRRIQLGLIVRY